MPSVDADLLTERRPLLLAAPRLESDTVPENLPNAAAETGTRQVADSSITQQLAAKVAASAFNFFLSGIAMAGIGAMLPGFEQNYEINDTQAALIFPAGVFGYVVATSMTDKIQSVCGRRGVAAVSSSIRLLFACILSRQPVFSAFLTAFAGLGYGTGLTDTTWNAWASSTSHPNIVQGLLHGSFSIGCAAGPAIVTIALRKSGWHLFYMILAALLSLELVSQVWAFRHDTKSVSGRPESSDEETSKPQHPLRNRSLWICGVFYLVYQGIEASFTDWIVLFLIRDRNADTAAAASASSIFWIGMAIGRYVLGAISERIGLRFAVALYILAASSAQVFLLVADEVTVALAILGVCGFFLAPLFPSGIVLLVSRAPPQDRIGVVAAAIAMGQLGGAIVPFCMGLLATHVGIQYLLHITLALSVLLLVLWTSVSRRRLPSTAQCETTLQGQS